MCAGGGCMYQISNEKFGLFVTELRKKKNLTQKDLAEKLYVSDKTVSKWERGLSMPNVVLLIPIADILDVTVTELLCGEKIDTQKNIDTKEVEELVVGSLDMAVRNSIHQHRKNWILAYLAIKSLYRDLKSSCMQCREKVIPQYLLQMILVIMN